MSNNIVETIKMPNGKIDIVIDCMSRDPRVEMDNLAKMVCFHRRYNLGDKHDFGNPDDFAKWMSDNKDQIAAIKPLYLLDHSGLVISTRDFNDKWDSGMIGFVYVLENDMVDEFGEDYDTEDAYRLISSEVNTYNAYISGEVYGFRAYRLNGDGKYEDDEFDSVYGYYDMESAITDAKGVFMT